MLTNLKKHALLLAFLLTCFVASSVKAQSDPRFYGYSEVGYSRIDHYAYGYSATYTNYNAALYYDPVVAGGLSRDSVGVDGKEDVGYSCLGQPPCPSNVYQIAAEVYMETNDLRWNSTYKEKSDHYAKAYYQYVPSPNYWFDPWGYGLWNSSFLGTGQYEYPWPEYFPFQNFVSPERTKYIGKIEVSIRALAPTISQISPDVGALGTSVVVRLAGTGFGQGWESNQTVSVSGSGVTAQVLNPYLPGGLDVNFQIAGNAAPGNRNVTVTAGGVTSNAVVFRVGDRTPQITGISPPEGSLGQNVQVTITGTGFGVNPQVQIDGLGVSNSVQPGATGTQITAIFSVANSTYLGNRNVSIRSMGASGFGFQQAPGNSNTSNAVSFNVTAPTVSITAPTAVGKNDTATATVEVNNAASGVKLQLLPDSGATGRATFDNNTTEKIVPNGTNSVLIKGVAQSTTKDDITLKAFNNVTNGAQIGADKTLSVAIVKIKRTNLTTPAYITDQTINTIVGERFKLTAEVQPTGISLSSKGWDIPEKRIKKFEVASGSASATVVGLDPLNTDSTDFVWINGGNKQVMFTAGITGATLKGKANFNVTLPEATIAVQSNAVSEVSDVQPGVPELHLGITSARSFGIKFTLVSFNVATGSKRWVQTINSTVDARFAPNSKTVRSLFQGLDGCYPYTATDAPFAEDSPGIPVSGFSFVEYNGNWGMWFMYKPVGTDSEWVPLTKINWDWHASADNTGFVPWQVTVYSEPRQSLPVPQTTNDYPIWSKIVASPNPCAQ